MSRSGGGDEIVEHAFAAGMLEIDLQLVALDLRDQAVSELRMKLICAAETKNLKP